MYKIIFLLADKKICIQEGCYFYQKWQQYPLIPEKDSNNTSQIGKEAHTKVRKRINLKCTAETGAYSHFRNDDSVVYATFNARGFEQFTSRKFTPVFRNFLLLKIAIRVATNELGTKYFKTFGVVQFHERFAIYLFI